MKLSEFRQSMGVSQFWLAERMNLTPVTISRYETGVHKPHDSFYYQLAYKFRFTPEELSKKIEEFVLRA